MTNAVDGVERALRRSRAYGIAAELLASPAKARDAELYSEMEQATAYPALAASVDEARRQSSGDGITERRLEQEYTHLFRKANAAPYEGSYVPAVRASAEMADIAGFQRAFGVRASGERADHVVTELEFLALLCLKEGLALGNGREEQAAVCRDAQAKFLRDHLGRWVSAFEAAVAKHARLALYPAVARLVRDLVLADAGAIGVTPEPVGEVTPGGEGPIQCGVGG